MSVETGSAAARAAARSEDRYQRAEAAPAPASAEAALRASDESIREAEQVCEERRAAGFGDGRALGGKIRAHVERDGYPSCVTITADRGCMEHLSDQAAAQALADAVTDAFADLLLRGR